VGAVSLKVTVLCASPGRQGGAVLRQELTQAARWLPGKAFNCIGGDIDASGSRVGGNQQCYLEA